MEKLMNFFVGILKLADFGLAREYHEHKLFTTVVSSSFHNER